MTLFEILDPINIVFALSAAGMMLRQAKHMKGGMLSKPTFALAVAICFLALQDVAEVIHTISEIGEDVHEPAIDVAGELFEFLGWVTIIGSTISVEKIFTKK